ncbi:hypothetical protein Ancab_000919 [Ancistrocladus abbreviatus]
MEISISSAFLLSPSPSLSSFSSFSSSKSSFFFNHTTTIQSLQDHQFQSSDSQSDQTTQQRASIPKEGSYLHLFVRLGVPELIVIAGVAALVFGPKNLPEVGRSVGKTVKSFQQAAKEFESELKKEPDSPANPMDTKPTAVSGEERDDPEVSTSKET